MATVSEPGLYKLVMRSRKPEARVFQRWVTHEVLPAIRRTGGYVAASSDEPEDVVMARAVLIAQDTIERQRAEIERMRPKALLGEAVEPSKASYTVTEATRYLAQAIDGVRRQDVFDLLRERHMMVLHGTAPTRKGIDTGRMVAVMHEFETSDGRTLQKQMGRLTGKGLAWLVSQFAGKGAAA